MSVIRVKKGNKKPYVMLDTTALNDTRLSFRAKGLHTYLMAKPDDWHVYIEQLEQISPREGRDAIRAALKELEDNGYIQRTRLRGEKGRMVGWDTTVYETPAVALEETDTPDAAASPIGLTNPPKLDQPKSAQPKSAQPKSANPQLLSIDLNQGLKVPRIEESTPPPPAHQYSAGFEQFWQAYPPPRRSAKRACYALWQKHKLEHRAVEMCEKVEALKASDDWQRGYEPAPRTWLGSHFDDDLYEVPVPTARQLVSDKEYRDMWSINHFAKGTTHEVSRPSGVRHQPAIPRRGLQD